MIKKVKEEPQGISRKEISAKYRTNQKKIFMNGAGSSKDPLEVSANSGRWTYRDGKFVRAQHQAPKCKHREYADWGRHLDRHDMLLKQVADGTYNR